MKTDLSFVPSMFLFGFFLLFLLLLRLWVFFLWFLLLRLFLYIVLYLFLFLMSSLSVVVLVSIHLCNPLLFFHSVMTMRALNMRAKETMRIALLLLGIQIEHWKC